MDLPKVPWPLPSRLTMQQAERLLTCVRNHPYPHDFLRHRNHAIIAVLLFAGLRKSKLLHLELGDVDLANQSLFVRRGKGNKDRVIPISPTLAGILWAYIHERARQRKTCLELFVSLHRDMGLTDQGLKGLVNDAIKMTGQHFHLHMLRHSFATLMLEGGCDIYSLSRMMGHADIKTTTIYLAATVHHLRSQIAKHPLNSQVHRHQSF